MDICLKCGAEPPLISQICHKCVRETVAISRLPDVLRMVDCKSCYSLKIPGTWLEFDDLESAVLSSLSEFGTIDPVPLLDEAVPPRES